jgi:hypothetical protein
VKTLHVKIGELTFLRVRSKRAIVAQSLKWHARSGSIEARKLGTWLNQRSSYASTPALCKYDFSLQ